MTSETTKSPVRVGIVGAGAVVKEVHLPVLRNMNDVRVVWLVDSDLPRARTLARAYRTKADVFSRVEECPDADIVLLAIPVGYREEPLRYMLSRGWNVLCEKPFAVSAAQHRAYVDQAARAGVALGAGLMRRYYRGHRTAKKLITSNIFGPVRSVAASQGARIRRTGRADWYQGDRRAAGGGVLIETGSHLIDEVFDILDIDRFQLDRYEETLRGGVDVDVRAAARLHARSQSEAIAFQVQLSNLNDLYHGIDITFDAAIVKLGVFPRDPVVLCDLSRKPIVNVSGDDGVLDIHAAFFEEWRDFIAQTREPGHRARISAETALPGTEFIDACYAYAMAPRSASR